MEAIVGLLFGDSGPRASRPVYQVDNRDPIDDLLRECYGLPRLVQINISDSTYSKMRLVLLHLCHRNLSRPKTCD